MVVGVLNSDELDDLLGGVDGNDPLRLAIFSNTTCGLYGLSPVFLKAESIVDFLNACLRIDWMKLRNSSSVMLVHPSRITVSTARLW